MSSTSLLILPIPSLYLCSTYLIHGGRRRLGSQEPSGYPHVRLGDRPHLCAGPQGPLQPFSPQTDPHRRLGRPILPPSSVVDIHRSCVVSPEGLK